MTKEKLKQEELENAVMQYANGSLNGMQTAKRINRILGAINGIIYKAGKCLNVDDGINRYPLPIERLRRKFVESDLVPSLHIIRKQNGLGNGTEAHINRECSTKHYRAGFNTLIGNVEAHYGV